MKKITFVMLFITLILFLGIGAFSNPTVADTVNNGNTERDIYLNIITSNKPQYEMVKAIVGDKHNVEYMFKDEKGSKEFLFNDETVINISNMDLFLYSGNDLEPWSSSLIDKLEKSNLGIINVSRGIRPISMQLDTETKDNPYYTVGLEEYKIALYNVKAAVQDKDPKNRDLYEENYNKSIEILDKTLEEIKRNKKALEGYQFIALDDKLDYFYRGIGITPIKVGDKTISDVITQNKLDSNKVIVLKDNGTIITEEGYKVINLTSYDGNVSIEELILKNHKALYDIIEIKDNK
ncbi:metal ABC transporter substrate-binding protein [Clostridium vincentii]|uniref:High-affinity zinc uptake system binding-protein ZnuA n=1 Tax=Clostridium vincentii TaxID=52704 RepID=A0A2T0BGV0_9CLOT|nr:zinc ABC transporter substrate-binding protein [Clostridium vincentii]PRR83109.1 High-affinity zinc uptake system binding-protein ZnuA precursor [Clostridium vincentii]